jgi:hypothetical protein
MSVLLSPNARGDRRVAAAAAATGGDQCGCGEG